MLDVAYAYNKYKFLGHEFLTWLWYIIDNDPGTISGAHEEEASLTIGNRMVFENRSRDHVETVIIKGDRAGLEEGRIALRKGALVTELALAVTCGRIRGKFYMKGENFNLSGISFDESVAVGFADDPAEAVLDKIFAYEQMMTLIDNLFKTFIKKRIGKDWEDSVRKPLQDWLQEGAAVVHK